MTARSSPHYPAVLRAGIKRKAGRHHQRSAWEGAKRWYAGRALVDQPLTEEQKDARWEAIWKR